MSEKRKTSVIWSHFQEEPDKRAKCRHCSTSLSFSGGSNGNLSRHMKTKHPKISLGFENLSPNSNGLPEEQASTSSEIPIQLQQNMLQFFCRSHPVRDVEKIHRQVLKIIIKEHLALRIVEDPEFKKLIELVSQCPSYKLPTRKTLSNKIIPILHDEILNEIKVPLQSATAVSLTLDGWTTKTNVKYLAVTAHYIDINTELKSHLIACEECNETHTAGYLSNFIKHILSEFNISDKIVAIVSDNDAAISGAIYQGGWERIESFIPTLNLIVQAAFGLVSCTLSKMQVIVEYFGKQKTPKQIHPSELKHKQDFTNWIPTYEMLQKLLSLKDTVMLTPYFTQHDLSLSLEDWELLNDMILIFEPFYETVKEISEEKIVTLSKVMVFCNLLDSAVYEYSSSNIQIQAMIQRIKEELMNYFGELDRSRLYAESSILDPRFKRLAFKNDNSYKNAVRVMRNRIQVIELPNSSETLEGCLPKHSINNAKVSRIWKSFDNDLNRLQSAESKLTALREFDNYLDDEYLDRNKDALVWWKERKHLYPRLYTYVLRRFCILASSVPCKRAFPATGQNINESRSLFKPNKVSSLIFLQNNL